jgi:aminoglycoside phosphotransferase family enzyme
MYQKVAIIFFLFLFSILYAAIELQSEESRIDAYRMRLERLSLTIKNMSKSQKQVITPKLLEIDTLLKDVERMKRLERNELVRTELKKIESKLKSRIRFIARFCQECQAGKMIKSPGELNIFEEKSSSKLQKIEEDQIQYVPTVETVQHVPSDTILNEESGRP